MRRTVDVIVVFVLIVSIFSLILLKEGVGVFSPTGNVVMEQQESSITLFPNDYYKFQYCISTEPGIMTVGIVDRNDEFELVERVELYDTFDEQGNPHYTYECEHGVVYQTVHN